MRRNPTYANALHRGEAHYGQGVTAYFYKGDRIIEGDSFGNEDFTKYIEEMGGDWQKGHLLAKSLGGEAISKNLIPMRQGVNDSTFKKVENTVHTLREHLSELEKAFGKGELHIEYNVKVNRDTDAHLTVKGHTFPGVLHYSIKVMCGTEIIDYPTLRMNLRKMDVELSSKLTGTIRVDGE